MIEVPPANFFPHFSSLLRQILWNRNYRTQEAVETFLNPHVSHIPHPEGLLKDLAEAISILLHARDRKEKVIVFGDYDVDGATSSALLVSFLKELHWNVHYFIPHRLKDGYGITLKATQKLLSEAPETKVLVSCDCGIASWEGIEFLKEKGVKIIVTDHHEVPSRRVSAHAILNPKQKECRYPDKKLAGVGVAFLLVMGLRRALGLRDFSLLKFLDLVALGTVCDVAELVGVNRIFVYLGLKQLSQTARTGLRTLLTSLNLYQKKIKGRDLGFLVGPRLNASGRIGDPELGVRMLLTDNSQEAERLLLCLETLNTQRKNLQEMQLKEAEERCRVLLQEQPKRSAFIIQNSSFHLGIVGLIASRLSETYRRPACVLTELQDEHELVNYGTENSLWKGSLRAPTGFHLAEILGNLREQDPSLFVSAGGHALAAGVALRENKLLDFQSRFEVAAQEHTSQIHSLKGDACLEDLEDAEEVLGALEPLGAGNPSPLIWVKNFSLEQCHVMKDVHIKMKGLFHGKTSTSVLSVLQFRSALKNQLLEWVRHKVSLDFLAELSENEWGAKKRVEFILKELLEVRGHHAILHSHANEIGSVTSV